MHDRIREGRLQPKVRPVQRRFEEPRRPQGVEEVGVEREPRIGPVLVAAHDEPVREEAAGRGVDQ